MAFVKPFVVGIL